MYSDNFALCNAQKHLSKNTILGAFYFLGFYIEFRTFDHDSFSNEIIQKAISSKDIENEHEFLKIKLHEDRHYRDFLTTLWGIGNIRKICDVAFSLGNADSEASAKLSNLYNLLATEKMNELITSDPLYYKPNGINVNIAQSRAYKYFIEYRDFLNKKSPIIFTKFYESEKEILSVPFSIDVLLELNAINEEFIIDQFFLQNTSNVGERDFIAQVYLNRFYNPNPKLAPYSAGIHHFANVNKLEDFYISAHFGSLIATLCLNLTREHFFRIPIPDSVKDNTISPHEDLRKNLFNSQAFNILLENEDRAAAFFLIVEHSKGIPLDNEEQWINTLLTKCNLGDLETVTNEVREEFENQLGLLLSELIIYTNFDSYKDAQLKKYLEVVHLLIIENVNTFNIFDIFGRRKNNNPVFPISLYKNNIILHEYKSLNEEDINILINVSKFIYKKCLEVSK